MIDANLIVFAIQILALFAIEWLYVFAARKLKIYAPYHDHSLHKDKAVTTGGIIFMIAALAALIPSVGSEAPVEARLLMVCSLTLAALSYYDDLWQVSVGGRLIVQILAVAVTFAFIGTPDHWLTYVLVVFCCVGYINSTNFMDGIDGMLGLNALVTLAAMRCLFVYPEMTGLHIDFVWLPTLDAMLMCSAVVFLVFNIFSRPKVFAGDVGSVTMGFFIGFMLLMIILHTGDWSIGVFAAVYVVETFMTVVYRLFSGKNIFHAHVEHVYQMIVQRTRMSDLAVSCTYAGLQAAIDLGWIAMPPSSRTAYAVVVASLLVVLHAVLRRRMAKAEG